MRKSLSIFLPLILLGVVAACADETTGPQALTDEVDATAEALALAEGLALPGTNTDRETGAAPTGTLSQPCRYNETEGRWVCAPIVRNGLTFHRSFAYLDENGEPMRRFDANLTAATNTRNAVNGTLLREDATIQIRSAGEMTISGLLGEETSRTFDGREIGRREIDVVTDQGPAHSVIEFANRSIAVVIPVVRQTDATTRVRPWPLSGQTVRGHAVTATRNGETRTERWRETTTFNGTAIVPVEIVSSSRGTLSCVRNLETGKLTCD